MSCWSGDILVFSAVSAPAQQSADDKSKQELDQVLQKLDELSNTASAEAYKDWTSRYVMDDFTCIMVNGPLVNRQQMLAGYTQMAQSGRISPRRWPHLPFVAPQKRKAHHRFQKRLGFQVPAFDGRREVKRAAISCRRFG
jgi:hypothetical protein